MSQIGLGPALPLLRSAGFARIMDASQLLMRCSMNRRWMGVSLVLVMGASQAADGLSAPRADSLWPQWQARVQLQTASPQAFGESAKVQEIKGAAVLGDYVLLQRPSLGVFRATGGIVAGSLAGAPLYKELPGQAPSLFLRGAGLQPRFLTVAENPQPLPYLGLGFSAAPSGSGFSISADLGMVYENPGSSLELGRALLGNQGVERAFRELRLSPMVQLSVRYAF